MSIEFEEVEYPKSKEPNELEFGERIKRQIQYAVLDHGVKFEELKVYIDHETMAIKIIKDGKQIV